MFLLYTAMKCDMNIRFLSDVRTWDHEKLLVHCATNQFRAHKVVDAKGNNRRCSMFIEINPCLKIWAQHEQCLSNLQGRVVHPFSILQHIATTYRKVYVKNRIIFSISSTNKCFCNENYSNSLIASANRIKYKIRKWPSSGYKIRVGINRF